MAADLFSFLTPLLVNISKIKAVGMGIQTLLFNCKKYCNQYCNLYTKVNQVQCKYCKSGLNVL